LVTFCDEVTKILRNLCLNFARQDGQQKKKKKKKSDQHAKNQTTKILDEQNMNFYFILDKI
jgi:hypothetical protein